MKLISVTVEGYGRFGKKTTMNMEGKLIAIVGANEAGKSTFLKAMASTEIEQVFHVTGGIQELTRDKTYNSEHIVVELKYALEDEDRSALSSIPGAENTRWFIVEKLANGSVKKRTIPPVERSIEQRFTLAKDLLTEAPKYNGTNIEYDLNELSKLISVQDENLIPTTMEKLTTAFSVIERMAVDVDSEALGDQLKVLQQYEAQIPQDTVNHLLVLRKPVFVFFSESERSLLAEYDLDRKNQPSQSLLNLLMLAGTQLEQLQTAIEQGHTGTVEQILEKANEGLKNLFSKIWSQYNVTVRLRVDYSRLSILIGSSESSYSSIAERSDGLKQFVALVAFITPRSANNPLILLMDEVETHLHYDAQADLVQMLAKQTIASKVIYTTHSIGALPEDLGTGVRLIEVDTPSTSVVRNWFWENEKPGFGPLLFGMGANSLAFLPMRYALFAEGASDLILLPSMFKEVTNRDFLGFQIVPELSTVRQEEVSLLESQAPRTVYLTDGDDGGQKLRNRLKRAGIPEERIFNLPDPNNEKLILEDFLDADIYLSAVNEELKRSGASELFPVEKLPTSNRPQAVKDWCASHSLKSPSKRAIAYNVLEQKSQNGLSIVDATYVTCLQQLYTDIVTILKLD